MKINNIYDLDLATRLKLEDEFFTHPFLMSYSGLNKLLYSPGAFYLHYILKQKDDGVDKSMIEGKLIHCMLLTPERFEEEFIVLPDTFPSENPKKIIDKLFVKLKAENPDLAAMPLPLILSLSSVHDAILELLHEDNLYQSLKTDGQRLDKILTEKNIEYLMFLTQAQQKTVVEKPMVEFAKILREQLMAKDNIRKIMGFNHLDCEQVFNELEVVSMPEEYTFGLKGIIDNLVIDHENKVIRINDLKKTSKALSSFRESMDYYNYHLQAAMYVKIINNNKKISFGVDYPIEFRFVVIDPYMHIAPFKVSEASLNGYMDQLNDALHVADMHFKDKDFSLPFAVAGGSTRENQEFVI